MVGRNDEASVTVLSILVIACQHKLLKSGLAAFDRNV